MDILAIYVAKLLTFITEFLGKGTSGPGKIATKISPTVLKKLGSKFKIILITGTNGKTTTSAMLTNILRQSGKKVVSNESGANLKNGIISCLAKHYPLLRREKIYAVLEVDEAYAKHVTADVSPVLIAVTNIFRDQLDRYGDVDKILSFMREACERAPGAILALNADEPLLYDFMPENRRIFYGFDVPLPSDTNSPSHSDELFCKKCKTAYSYSHKTFNHLGNYHCDVCGAARPDINVSVSEIVSITPDSSEVVVGSMKLSIPQPGAYNIYNALCAVACSAVLGASESDIQNGILSQQSKFGRQETVLIESKELRIILVKNPAGALEAINSVLPDKDMVDFGILLNDNYGDGRDVSWIYDVEFEKLASLNSKNILIGGTRLYDMAVRLKCAELDTRKFLICDDYDTLIYHIKTQGCGRTYLFTTYSAMTSLRKYLQKKGYIKKLWK